MFTDIPLWFLVLSLITSVVSGATASVIGFGIGSLLTPVLAIHLGTDAAIAAVALPHLAGGLLRGWRLRNSIDRSVLVRFGILSAIGGLIGAFLFARLAPLLLSRILGALLLLTATAGIAGWSKHWKPDGVLVWLLGALSGFFGGITGTQGGLRAAALSAFGLTPTVFVATSTVIGIFIDVARTPVYLYSTGPSFIATWNLIILAVAGVMIGTLIGERILFGLPPARFRITVSAAVGLLGLWFLLRPA